MVVVVVVIAAVVGGGEAAGVVVATGATAVVGSSPGARMPPTPKATTPTAVATSEWINSRRRHGRSFAVVTVKMVT